MKTYPSNSVNERLFYKKTYDHAGRGDDVSDTSGGHSVIKLDKGDKQAFRSEGLQD